jgi:hypothetical protein
MPHRTRSHHNLPQVNKEEVPGRDRAWTTTDVRPRIGPVSARPELSPAIEIVQTSPTPTEGPSPVRQNMRQEDRNQVRDAIYIQDKNTDLRMWEGQSSRKFQRSNRPSTAPPSPSEPSKRPEPLSKRARDASASPRVYQASLPGVPEIHVQSTGPVMAPHFQQTIQTEVSPLDSPSSSLEVDIGEQLRGVTREPLALGETPSAVSLHNLHIAKSREQEIFAYMPPQGVGVNNNRTYGFDSARGMHVDKSRRLLGIDAPSPSGDKSSPTRAKKITGFFSRLKR